MGVLYQGVWREDGVSVDEQGHFLRKEAAFRSWITADGSVGPSGEAGFAAASGRYHLYVSYACPWAHRTLIFRMLKGLEDMISVSVVHYFMGVDGWSFAPGEGVVPDTINGKAFLRDVYLAAMSDYTGRVSVPVLWDKERATIVSNESSEIIRMLNSAFDGLGATQGDYYPAEHRDEIEMVNARVYETVNNGVYRSGFAQTQEAYEEAVEPLFDTLDWLEARLAKSRYLVGNRLTEADLRLFPTLARFDPVYVGHFKCNIRRIVDYPNLWGHTRDIYQMPGVAETVNLQHIKNHYYQSHTSVNPTGIVPIGPQIDWLEPHGRDGLGS
jgi:putative glutathione S-transferase